MLVNRLMKDMQFCFIALCLCLCVLSHKSSVVWLLPLVRQSCFLDSTIHLGDLFILVHADDLAHFLN